MPARRTARPWARLRLRVPEDAAESLGVLCIELGASGTMTGARDLRRARPSAARRSPSTRFEAYFPPRRSRAGLERSLQSAIAALSAEHPRLGRRRVRLESFAVPDYGPVLRGHFPPIAVGRRLLIAPPWAPPAEIGTLADGREVLRIDPGQAFGTGHHPTTRGCLVALERACAQAPARRGLDVGSGSGILTLAMRKLGVRELVAVDNDPIARAATRATLSANRCRGVSILPSLGAARGRFDVVVANLFADLLVTLAGDLRARVRPGGRLIVSGLLASQESKVRAALEKNGFAVVRRQSRSTWVTLELDATPSGRSQAASRATAARARRTARGAAEA